MSHNIMAGMEFRRLATGRAAVNSPRGTFTFNGTLTGYAPADFVLGLPQTFGTPGPEVRGRVAEWRDGFFVLDKWQVSRKLTLNYGLRYELPTVAYTINGNATELNPDQTALVGGTPGFPLYRSQPQRLGAAPRHRLSHHREDRIPRRRRHLLQSEPDQQLHVPEHESAVQPRSSSAPGPSDSRRPVCPTRLACPASVRSGAPTAALIVTDPWDQPTGRMNQWSAGLERQLWSGGGLEVQYLGSHSYHLDRSFYNNTPLPGPGAVNSRRPNPLFGPIRTIDTDEIANYESMSVIFRQRMTHGLQMLASYTWSHTLDVTTDSNGGGTPMNPYRWKADYGNSNWDIRHRFVATFRLRHSVLCNLESGS